MKEEIIRDLTKSHLPGDEQLLGVLHTVCHELCYAYVLDWIPEQDVSIYTVIIPDRRVMTLEISDEGCSEITTLMSLHEFKRKNHRLDARRRRKLAAIENVI